RHHRSHAEDVPARRKDGRFEVNGRDLLIEAAYLAASVFFILGLRSLSNPDKARRGMQYAAIGMLLAILGTLANAGIVTWPFIVVGLVLGTAIGIPLGTKVPMTAMPQQI